MAPLLIMLKNKVRGIKLAAGKYSGALHSGELKPSDTNLAKAFDRE
jgi:hypothetical protein